MPGTRRHHGQQTVAVRGDGLRAHEVITEAQQEDPLILRPVRARPAGQPAVLADHHHRQVQVSHNLAELTQAHSAKLRRRQILAELIQEPADNLGVQLGWRPVQQRPGRLAMTHAIQHFIPGTTNPPRDVGAVRRDQRVEEAIPPRRHRHRLQPLPPQPRQLRIGQAMPGPARAGSSRAGRKRLRHRRLMRELQPLNRGRPTRLISRR